MSINTPVSVNVNTAGASALNADLFVSQDFSSYGQVCAQITGTWVGTIQLQASQDGVTYYATPFVTALGVVASSTTSNAVITFYPSTKYYRLRMSAYTSGTAFCTAESFFEGSPIALTTSTPVSGTVTANTTETTLVTPLASVVTTTASNNLTSIKASAGTVYSIEVTNKTAATIYVKYYNKASAPVVASDVPTRVIPVSAGAYVCNNIGRVGSRFATGIAIAVTGAATDTDATNTAAGAVIITNYI